MALSLLLGAAAQPSELKLGIFLSWESERFGFGPYIAPAILMAVDSINKRSDILPNTELKWVWHESYFCDTQQATVAMLDMELAYEVDGYIGPGCSTDVSAVAPAAEYWKKPIISYMAASPLLSDKALYPNVARTSPSDAGGAIVALDFARQRGWNTLAVVYSETEDAAPTGDFIMDRINESPDIDLGYTHEFDDTLAANGNHTMLWMPELKASGCRIVLVVGNCHDFRSTLLAANRLDMLLGYQYFLFMRGDITACTSVEGSDWPTGWGPEANDEAARSFNNTLTITVEDYSSAETAAFMSELAGGFQRGDFEPHRYPPSGTITPVRNVVRNPLGLPYANGTENIAYLYALNWFSRSLYDSIHLYARAAHAAISEGEDPSVQPEEITKRLSLVNFTGLTGFVTLDENMDRSPAMLLMQMRMGSDGELASHQLGVHAAEEQSFEGDAISEIYYPGNTLTPPPAWVLRECTSADYDVSAADECTAAMELPLIFWLKAESECEDAHPEDDLSCPYLPAESGPGVAVIVISALAFVLAIACAAWVLVFRKETIVVYAQPPFCLLFLIGCALVNASSAMRVGRNYKLACVVSPCLFHLSFTLAFSALLAKCYRVWKIFINKRLQRRAVQASNVIQVCAILVLVDAAILTALLVREDLGSETVTVDINESSTPVEYEECVDAGALGYFLWVLKAFVMIATCVFAWQMRDVDERYAESRHIMIAAYQATILCAIAGMVAITAESLSVEVLVQAFASAIATSGAIVAIFGPKIAFLHGCGSDAADQTTPRPSHSMNRAKVTNRQELSEGRRGSSKTLSASQEGRSSNSSLSRRSLSTTGSVADDGDETAELAYAKAMTMAEEKARDISRAEKERQRRVLSPTEGLSDASEGDVEESMVVKEECVVTESDEI